MPYPGPEWPTVVAALLDGVDVVVSAVPGAVSATIASRLAARARQRGCVFVPYGRWEGADVTLQVMRGRWEGLGQGRGRLCRRLLSISARGRGAASRPKEIKIWVPTPSGRFGAHSTARAGDPAGTAGAAPGARRGGPLSAARPTLTLVTGLARADSAADGVGEAG